MVGDVTLSMPLEGYRVIDTTTWLQSLVSMMLGDMGADVIKVEDRVAGDPLRGLMKLSDQLEKVKFQRNWIFEHANRNKKSLALDLKKQKGRDILHKLVEKSDVFVHNFRKNAATKLGMDYATLSKQNPRLIYATSTGWGSKGPDVHRPTYDRMALARAGFMTIAGEPGWPPVRFDYGVADQTTANMTTLGVVTALLMREKTGLGQEVEASVYGSALQLLGMPIDFKLLSGVEIFKYPRETAGNPLWNYYKCKDDQWIMLGLQQADRYWSSFCQAMGLEQLEKAPEFKDMEARGKNAAEMVSILDKVFATKTREEWLAILESRGDLIFEPINTVSDTVKDPQAWDNDYFIEFEDPSHGKISMLGFPIHMGHASMSVRLPVPEFGQHTEEVLQSVLGYTWDEIAELKAEEVI